MLQNSCILLGLQHKKEGHDYKITKNTYSVVWTPRQSFSAQLYAPLYRRQETSKPRVQPRNSEMCDSISAALSKPRRPLIPIANESFRLKINDFEKKLLIDGPVTVIQ